MFENILKQLIELSFCAADVYLLYQFSKIFKLKLKISMKSLWFISSLTVLIIYIIGYFFMYTGLNELLILAVSIIYCSLVFEGKIVSKILIPVLFQLCMGIVTVLVSSAYLFFTHLPMEILFESIVPRIFVTIIMKSVMFLIIYLVLKFRKNDDTINAIQTKSVLLYFGLNFFILLLAFEVLFLENKYLTESLLRVFLMIFILSFVLIVFLLVSYFQYKEQVKENELLLAEAKLKQQNYISEIKNQVEVVKLKHDIRNHLLTIRGLTNANQNKRVIDYIDTLQNLDAVKMYINTKNDVINAILNSKITENPDIQFKVQIEIDTFDIQMFDLTVVLGNSIDNAIEAVKNLPQDKRIINVVLSENDHYCKLFISNEFKTTPNFVDKELISSKRVNQKGIGLSNIKEVISKYNGSFEISSEMQLFKLTVVLKKQFSSTNNGILQNKQQI